VQCSAPLPCLSALAWAQRHCDRHSHTVQAQRHCDRRRDTPHFISVCCRFCSPPLLYPQPEPGTSAWCSDLPDLLDAMKAQVPNIYILSDITLTGPLPAVTTKMTITGFCQAWQLQDRRQHESPGELYPPNRRLPPSEFMLMLPCVSSLELCHPTATVPPCCCTTGVPLLCAAQYWPALSHPLPCALCAFPSLQAFQVNPRRLPDAAEPGAGQRQGMAQQRHGRGRAEQCGCTGSQAAPGARGRILCFRECPLCQQLCH